MAERKAVVGTISMAASNLFRLGLQFLYLPVLAHLLEPAAFGLFALAMPLVMLASIVCDAGLGNALIRHGSPSRDLESTVFWLSMLLGTCLALGVSAIAWPVGYILGEPKLPLLIVACASILPIVGALSVANARISRTRRFGLFAVGDVASAIISSSAAIAAAFAGFGPWSIVVQQLTLWAV